MMTDHDTEERAAYQRAVERAKDEIARLKVGLAAEQELRARSEMIVLATRKVVSGPNSVNYTQLAAALDAYDKAAEARSA